MNATHRFHRSSVLCAFLAAAIAVLGLIPGTAHAVDAPAKTPPTVVPALQHWKSGGGSFGWSERSRVVVESPALQADGAVFATDLSRLTGRSVQVATGTARAGDIALKIDQSIRPAAEGYQLAAGSTLRITAANPTGAFWGTRTVLQLLHQSTTVPGGTATDWPLYPQRGVLLSAEVKYYSIPFIQRLIRNMSYLKLNMLTLQEILPIASHPELGQFFPRLTPAQLQQVKNCARQYHVNIVLSTGFPSHTEPYYPYEPDLQLKDGNGNARPMDLDIGNPATYDFIRKVANSYLKADPAQQFLIGGDEYLGDQAAYENFPSLVAWAKEHVGADAPASDSYRYWANWMNRQIRAQGKTTYLWNDELWQDSTLPLDPSVVVDYWIKYPGRMSVAGLAANGNKLLNSDAALYYSYPDDIPDVASEYLSFAPNIFNGGQTLPIGDKHVLGASMSIWPDQITADDEEKVETGIAPVMQMLAEKTWSTEDTTPSDYTVFKAMGEAVGTAPQPAPARPLAAPKVYTLQNSATGRFLADADSAVVQQAATQGHWLLTQDAVGAYSLRSAGSGKCVQVSDPPSRVGGPVGLATCDRDVPQQRFDIEPAGDDFVLRSQASGQVLGIKGNADPVVQNGEPGPAAKAWRARAVAAAAQATVELSTDTDYTGAEGTASVTATVHNWANAPAQDLQATLDLPDGWTSTPAAALAVPAIAAGGSAQVTWTVRVPSDAADGIENLAVHLGRASETLAASAAPITVAGGELAHSQALVANLDDASVSPIDLGTGTAGDPIGVGSRPGTMAVSADGSTAYVPNQRSASVSVIDTASHKVTATIPVGAIPIGAALTTDGKTLWVGDYGDNAVQPVDLSTNTAGAKIPIGTNPEDLAISPDGKTLWAADLGGTVDTVDLATGTAGAPIALSGGPDGLVISPDGKTVYVSQSSGSTVTPIDAATRKAGTPIEVGSGPFHLTLAPDGHTMAVAIANAGQVAFIDTATNTVTGRVDVGPSPISVAYSPSGRLAFVTDSGNKTVVPIDTAQLRAGAPIAVGTTPVWISIVPDGASG